MARPTPRRFGRLWLLSPLGSAALGVVIFLCTQGLREPLPDLPRTPTPPPNWAADFPARIDAVTTALRQLPWPLPAAHEEPQGAGSLRWVHRRYELTLPQPSEEGAIAQTLEPVRTAAAGVTVRVTDDAVGAHVQIGIDGLLTHSVTLHWLGRRARVAIIIDDLGDDLRIARALAGVPAEVTFGVLPFRPFSKEVAELAKLFKREVLLYLPVNASDTADRPAPGVLPVSDARADVVQQLDESLAVVPGAVGVSNHVGSHFTRDRVHMLWVLDRLKERGLFFVDSQSTPHSVACDVAAAIALPCVARTVALKEVDDQDAMRTQIEELPRLARTEGRVIAIAHARATTVAALQGALPRLKAAGVEIVPVSTFIAQPLPTVPAERALSAR